MTSMVAFAGLGLLTLVLFSCGCFFGALIASVLGAVIILYLMPQKVEKINSAKKAVFITGCDHGFGHQLAKRLDDMGFVVFAGCLFPDKDGGQALKSECSERMHVVPLDVTDDWKVRGALKLVKENLGDNDLWAVVNNAGIAVFTEIEWCSVIQFQRIMDVNVMGVVRVTKLFLPLVRKCNGRIINVASLAGRFTVPAFAAYSMSKKACIAFSDALRLEMKKFDVSVITIEPGLYRTPIADRNYLEEQNRKSWSETPPEVKEVYGEEYFDAFLTNIGEQMKRARPNVNEVIELMERAVTETKPQIRYVPRHSIFIALMLEHLPTSMTDRFFRKYQPKSKPRLSSSSSNASEESHK